MFGVLAALGVILAVGIYFRSEQVINTVYAAPTALISIDQDAAVIARGQHLATAVSVCVDCHGANLAGGIVMDDPAIGRIVASNLTTGEGGIGGQRTDNYPRKRTKTDSPSCIFVYLRGLLKF